MIIDMLNTEAMTNVRVAYGTIVDDLKEVSRSYKEAKMALDVGNIFFSDKHVIAYNNLGIGRLIYQLPVQLCSLFIQESFGELSLEDFDEETITTIVKFFENSLNVSETSRQLFIHRNTLVYRLDKKYDIDDIILSEYGTTVVGLEMLRSVKEEDAEIVRNQQIVKSAINTLSFSEIEAITHVFDELDNKEGVLVASKIADRVGITRSVIVNALRKFESAGVIESHSSGMKGTYIKVLNDEVFTELAKIRK